MLRAFHRFIELSETEDDQWAALEDIISLRADALINKVLVGMSLSLDEAADILRKPISGLSDKEKEKKNILLAAYDNLIDFAAAEEIQMTLHLEEVNDDIEDESDFVDYESVFYKYNYTYASQENQEVLFAAGIANWWISIDNNKLITYITQRDERVRDTHAILDGESYLKSEFPQELIPPIEWGCRCYLSVDHLGVFASKYNPTPFEKLVNPIFKESMAKGGKIFSDAHPYFDLTPKQKNQLQPIISRLKHKYHVGKFNS